MTDITPSHGENTGSSPVGVTSVSEHISSLTTFAVPCDGTKRSEHQIALRLAVMRGGGVNRLYRIAFAATVADWMSSDLPANACVER